MILPMYNNQENSEYLGEIRSYMHVPMNEYKIPLLQLHTEDLTQILWETDD